MSARVRRSALWWFVAGCWLLACQPPGTSASSKSPGVKRQPQALPPTAGCQSAADCPAPDQLCARAACVQGTCQLQPSEPPTRCPLTLEWAQRQADLHSIDMHEKGVCRKYTCMPRLLCMQRCGDELAQSIAPSLPVVSCPEGECDKTPDPNAVAKAKEGLRECLFECGFPQVEPPKAANAASN
jgi:hypothetical protein